MNPLPIPPPENLWIKGIMPREKEDNYKYSKILEIKHKRYNKMIIRI